MYEINPWRLNWDLWLSQIRMALPGPWFFVYVDSAAPVCVVMKTAIECIMNITGHTVYPKKYAHGFVVLCFVVVMQSFIMNSHEVFIHIHQGCFAGTGAIVRLPQCQWSKPDGYGKISQCITTAKHSKAKTVCIFLGIYCTFDRYCSYHIHFANRTTKQYTRHVLFLWPLGCKVMFSSSVGLQLPRLEDR